MPHESEAWLHRRMTETAPSPDDPAPEELPAGRHALQALVRELTAERDAVIARCEKLEHLLRVARNAQYGRSSEKLNSDQLELTLEVPGDRDAAAEVRLRDLPWQPGAGPGARAADQGRPAHRTAGGSCAGRQVSMAPAALPSGADDDYARHCARPLDARLLGGLCRRRTCSGLRAAQGVPLVLNQNQRGRDNRARAGSGARADEDRLLLGNRPR